MSLLKNCSGTHLLTNCAGTHLLVGCNAPPPPPVCGGCGDCCFSDQSVAVINGVSCVRVPAVFGGVAWGDGGRNFIEYNCASSCWRYCTTGRPLTCIDPGVEASWVWENASSCLTGGTGDCCGFSAVGNWYNINCGAEAGTLDVVMTLNNCCKCSGGSCSPTSDNTASVCDGGGINTCTASQDDDCPP